MAGETRSRSTSSGWGSRAAENDCNDGDEWPDGSQMDDSPLPVNVKFDYSQIKWRRLASSYVDQYLDVFNGSFETDEYRPILETSQLGSVIWTGPEKKRVFDMLARKGRHDLPAIATFVGKSQVEVEDYLMQIKSAQDGRQNFSKNAKNVSHAKIEAAVEIDGKLEEALEKAADALAAFQDFYDCAEAQNSSLPGEPWIIDNQVAQSLAEEAHLQDEREAEVASITSSQAPHVPDITPMHFFDFESMIELSERLFMNTPDHSKHAHWTEYAEPGERPSLTVNAAQDLYSIVKHRVQVIIQTAMFLTESRLRSTETPSYLPARVMKDTDVIAALHVLNMPVNYADYWFRVVKRGCFNVVLGGHGKGEDKQEVKLEQIQELLASQTAGCRPQFLGNNAKLSWDGSIAAPSPSSSSQESMRASEDDELSGIPREEESSQERPTDVDTGSESADSTRAPKMTYTSRKQRLLQLEYAEDEFMERLDRLTAANDDKNLRAVLNLPAEDELSDEQLGHRPRKRRKMKDELLDWADKSYYASWEDVGQGVSAEPNPQGEAD